MVCRRQCPVRPDLGSREGGILWLSLPVTTSDQVYDDVSKASYSIFQVFFFLIGDVCTHSYKVFTFGTELHELVSSGDNGGVNAVQRCTAGVFLALRRNKA